MNQSIIQDFSTVLEMIDQVVGWPSLCTIQAPPDASAPPATGLGQIDLSTWTDVAGLGNIQCFCGLKSAPPTSWEGRLPTNFWEKAEYVVILRGYYPEITQSMRAMVDGTAYDIRAVASPSYKIATWMAVRRYSL